MNYINVRCSVRTTLVCNRNISGTKDYRLTFTGTISTDLLVWQNVFLNDRVDSRSCTGYIIMTHGGPWSNKLKHIVALSTAEAQNMSLAASSHEAMVLRHLLQSFKCPIKSTTLTCEDNESCITLATKGMTPSKHINIKCHYIQYLVKQS